MQWHAYFVPKNGHEADEYEDAFAGDASQGRYVIADGASESSYAGQWARMLVDEFLQASLASNWHWADWLPAVRRRWASEVEGRNLSWYAEAKAELGAFATFLAVTLETDRWQAVAVGDSCLFHLREGALLQAFPVKNADAFSNATDLVGSRLPLPAVLQQQQVRSEGEWREEDCLLLMTDALAQWFLREVENMEKPWRQIDDVLGANDAGGRYVEWIDNLRRSGKLRNDDCTIVIIRAGAGTER